MNKLGTPNSMKDSFKMLAKHSFIEIDLSQQLMKMVGFRETPVILRSL